MSGWKRSVSGLNVEPVVVQLAGEETVGVDSDDISKYDLAIEWSSASEVTSTQIEMIPKSS